MSEAALQLLWSTDALSWNRRMARMKLTNGSVEHVDGKLLVLRVGADTDISISPMSMLVNVGMSTLF